VTLCAAPTSSPGGGSGSGPGTGSAAAAPPAQSEIPKLIVRCNNIHECQRKLVDLVAVLEHRCNEIVKDLAANGQEDEAYVLACFFLFFFFVLFVCLFVCFVLFCFIVLSPLPSKQWQKLKKKQKKLIDRLYFPAVFPRTAARGSRRRRSRRSRPWRRRSQRSCLR
jgi:hypothetical protein